MTSLDPCENCGLPVVVDELFGAIPTGPATSSRVQTPFGPATATMRSVVPNPLLYDVETMHFTASGGGTAEGRKLTEHTPARCRSARAARRST